VTDFATLRQAFPRIEPARALEPGVSGVLVPLVPKAEGLHILFTRRTTTMRRHAGEVSFPGGGMDPGDAGPLAAALRETEEEVGIPRSKVDVLGHLADYHTYYGRQVCAYVGIVQPQDIPATARSAHEVAELLVVPLARLLDPEVYEGRTFASLDEQDRSAEDARLADARGHERVVHYFHVTPRGTVPIWGITAELLTRFLRQAEGWVPPHPPRIITDPGGFRP